MTRLRRALARALRALADKVDVLPDFDWEAFERVSEELADELD